MLFAYKDNRFGCLTRAAAVLLFYYEPLIAYLDQNPGVNNRLACLAREVLALPYLKPVLATLALLGIYLVEPFYARTIEKGPKHSNLKKCYKDLHRTMVPVKEEEQEEYTSCTKPYLEGVSMELFSGVKSTYGMEVVETVVDVANECKSEVVNLTNLMMPELKIVLVRQRRDYGIDEESFPVEYPVEEQASNVDDTPVHNIGMERQCGKVGHRLLKLGNLKAVSRSIILQRAKEMRAGSQTSFRGFKDAVKAKEEVELKWSQKTQDNFRKGKDEKQQMAQKIESKRLDKLNQLKALGGPFTDAREVEDYLKLAVSGKKKKQRMKLELQFARDSSTLLPQVDPLFKVQVTLPSGKRRDKTPVEFGSALMTFLGRRGDRTTLEYSQFQESLQKLGCYDDK